MRTTTDWRPPGWTPSRYDESHAMARTHHGDWDGLFEAPCPHGHVVTWQAAPGRQPKPQCNQHRRRP